MAETRWKRATEYTYQFIRDGVVLATVEREPSLGNGHFSIWFVQGERSHHPTLRDAKAWVEREFASTPTERPTDG